MAKQSKSELESYVALHPVEHEGESHPRHSIIKLTAEKAAGWVKAGYIKLIGKRPAAKPEAKPEAAPAAVDAVPAAETKTGE